MASGSAAGMAEMWAACMAQAQLGGAPAASSSAVAAQPASMQMQAMQQMALMASQQAYKEAMQKFEQMQQFSTMLAASAEAQGQGQGETPAPDGPEEEEEEVVPEEPPGKEESPNTPAPKESKEKAADHGGPNEGKNLADDGQGATDLEQTEKEPEKPKSIYKRVGLLNVDSQTQLEVLARLVVKQPKKKFEPAKPKPKRMPDFARVKEPADPPKRWECSFSQICQKCKASFLFFAA